jgi:RNA polymerase sigma-70 factor (ECF subfamily)
MDRDELRLSRIDTLWSVVRRAHDGAGPSLAAAQQRFIDVYGGAVRRYLLGALHDEDAAQEVFQEFALNLLRGVFQRADPNQGRFRNLVKTAIFHLIVDYQRRQRRRWQEKPLQSETPDVQQQPCALADDEEAFTRSWRNQLLSGCWEALADSEQTTGKPYHAVLRFRLDHPEMHSPELAEGLSAQLGKSLTAGAVRVLTHRAREMFADRLLDAVMDSLAEPSLDEAEQELIDLGLLRYCRTALARRRETRVKS